LVALNRPPNYTLTHFKYSHIAERGFHSCYSLFTVINYEQALTYEAFYGRLLLVLIFCIMPCTGTSRSASCPMYYIRYSLTLSCTNSWVLQLNFVVWALRYGTEGQTETKRNSSPLMPERTQTSYRNYCNSSLTWYSCKLAPVPRRWLSISSENKAKSCVFVLGGALLLRGERLEAEIRSNSRGGSYMPSHQEMLEGPAIIALRKR
jgi:hypothetical protein